MNTPEEIVNLLGKYEDALEHYTLVRELKIHIFENHEKFKIKIYLTTSAALNRPQYAYETTPYILVHGKAGIYTPGRTSADTEDGAIELAIKYILGELKSAKNENPEGNPGYELKANPDF